LAKKSAPDGLSVVFLHLPGEEPLQHTGPGPPDHEHDEWPEEHDTDRASSARHTPDQMSEHCIALERGTVAHAGSSAELAADSTRLDELLG
jgi:hypothetical protein